MPAEVRTPRLLLRGWRDSDLDAFAAVNADPEVVEHLGGQPLTREESDALAGRAVGHWRDHGFGWYAVEPAATGPWGSPGTMIGFVGVSHHRAFPAEVELGWRLAGSAWGYGLATEGARAVRDLAFARLDVPRLISVTVPANRRSWRVMQKLGFTIWLDDVAFQHWRLQVWQLPRRGPTRAGGTDPTAQ